MIDDIDLNKAAIIRRCLKRIEEEYRDDPRHLENAIASTPGLRPIEPFCRV